MITEKLIKLLFQKSIELNRGEFTQKEIQSNWIGNPPTTLSKIEAIEKKLNVSFPNDYKELLLICNGFKPFYNSVEPSFLPVEEIDYTKNIHSYITDFSSGEDDFVEVEKKLQRSILIAGKDEEQHFLLIPPIDKNAPWEYWKFANWIPGEEEYINLKEYFKEVIEFLSDEIENEKMQED